MRLNSIIVVSALVSLAACGPKDQPVNADEGGIPPVSEPTLNGGAPVTITPGDAMYPSTPGNPEGAPPPAVVTPERSGMPPAPQ